MWPRKEKYFPLLEEAHMLRVAPKAGFQKLIAYIRGFGDFRNPERLLKRLANIIFWALLMLPLVVIPLFFLVYSAFH